jgi:hypothetical protein
MFIKRAASTVLLALLPGVEPVRADGDFTIGPDYTNAPELAVREGVPRGVVHSFTLTSQESGIYPGLNGPYKRGVWVYVPSQYVPGTPAPFIVVQDGRSYTNRLVPVLDNMIHERRLPDLIAVMIQSGGGDGQGSERGLEYDTVSDKYTMFNQEEATLHNWVPANRRMAAALKARGYHYEFWFCKGAGHVDRRAVAQTLPEALSWLWQGYSEHRQP